MAPKTNTIGGDTDAIRRYAEEVRLHGEDTARAIKENTKKVRDAFLAEASAFTRTQGVAPVYEELKTSLNAAMDRLDAAADVILKELESTGSTLTTTAAEFDSNAQEGADRLSQVDPNAASPGAGAGAGAGDGAGAGAGTGTGTDAGTDAAEDNKSDSEDNEPGAEDNKSEAGTTDAADNKPEAGTTDD